MRFILNGQETEIADDAGEDRLLWILRDDFGLNGPKYGCGVGSCGACLVHVDGAADYACLLRGVDVEGRRVTTIEGLGGTETGLHPVQRAWVVAQVPQCGFCQNGQVLAAAALLADNPGADEAAIAATMDRVICRCGTQIRIRAAIRSAQSQLEGEG